MAFSSVILYRKNRSHTNLQAQNKLGDMKVITPVEQTRQVSLVPEKFR